MKSLRQRSRRQPRMYQKCYNTIFKPPRSETGSLRDEIPQAEFEAAASNVRLSYRFPTPGAFAGAQVVCQGRPES